MSDDEAIVAWKEDDEGVEIRVNSPTSGEKGQLEVELSDENVELQSLAVRVST